MTTIKKLLDTDPTNGNTKVAKTAAFETSLGPVRLASLSLLPDDTRLFKPIAPGTNQFFKTMPKAGRAGRRAP